MTDKPAGACHQDACWCVHFCLSPECCCRASFGFCLGGQVFGLRLQLAARFDGLVEPRTQCLVEAATLSTQTARLHKRRCWLLTSAPGPLPASACTKRSNRARLPDHRRTCSILIVRLF